MWRSRESVSRPAASHECAGEGRDAAEGVVHDYGRGTLFVGDGAAARDNDARQLLAVRVLDVLLNLAGSGAGRALELHLLQVVFDGALQERVHAGRIFFARHVRLRVALERGAALLRATAAILRRLVEAARGLARARSAARLGDVARAWPSVTKLAAVNRIQFARRVSAGHRS